MIALDTNFIAYAEAVDDDRRYQEAQRLLAQIDRRWFVIPAQVAGELFRVLTRKARLSSRAAAAVVTSWTSNAKVADTTRRTMIASLDLATAHNLQIWDAVILQSSAEAGARVLLSEDMHQGFVWAGVTVVNPFAPGAYSPLLAPYMT